MEKRCLTSAVRALVWLAVGATAFHQTSAATDAPSAEDAILLEESMDIDIRSSSEATLRYLNRTQVLTQHGVDEYRSAAAGINPWVTVRDFRGAVISPDGKRTETKKQQLYEVAYSDEELYTEFKTKALDFPGVVPGSTVEYQYEQVFRSLFFLPKTFELQNPVPSRLMTLSVRVPA